MRHAAAVGVLLVGLGAACSTTSPATTPTPSADAGLEAAASLDAGPEPGRDAEALDAATETSNALRVFGRKGDLTDDALPPSGPGIVLDGGFEGAVTRAWIHTTVSGGAPSRGDVVVLTPQASDGAAWKIASFHSAWSVAFDGATTADLVSRCCHRGRCRGGGSPAAIAEVRGLKGTPLMAAVQGVYDRGGVVGGSSRHDHPR